MTSNVNNIDEKPINPAIEAARVSLGDKGKGLSPRYFFPDQAFKFKAVSSIESPLLESNIPRSFSCTNIETNTKLQHTDTLMQVIQEQNEQIKDLSLKLSHALGLDETSKILIAQLDETIKNMHIELEMKDQKLKRMLVEHEELSQEFKDIKMRQRKTNDSYEYQIEGLNKEITVMRNEMNSLRTANQEQLEQIKELRITTGQLNQLIACLKNQNEGLSKERKSMNDTIQHLENKVMDLQVENDKLTKLNYKNNNSNVDVLVRTSSFEINELIKSDEKVLWKRMIKTLKISSKEKDIKKKHRLSGNLNQKKH